MSYPHDSTLPRPLGDDLILRRSTAADADRLGAFNEWIHTADDDPEDILPNERLSAWTRDLLRGDHPTFGVDDFTIVEDTRTGKIVSALNLIHQTWTYDGIPFPVGRPELVGTDPEYRHRGLIRKQFEVIHEWSRTRGDMVQAITGIPYYYRLFGYEMAMTLGGSRKGFAPQNVPALKEDETEPYLIRPANPDDLPWIARTAEQNWQRQPVAPLRDAAQWRYELDGKNAFDINRVILYMITTLSGEPAGFLACPPYPWGTAQFGTTYELAEGISWHAVTPTVLRFLWKIGQENGATVNRRCDGIGLALGESHPAYGVTADRLPVVREPYAWYIRVADLPAFLMHIRPALEARLAKSALCGFSGSIKLTYYQKQGQEWTFENGKLTGIEAIDLMWSKADCAFPGLTILQLVFGYRSLKELRYAHADCWAGERSSQLLNALFPRCPSDVWAIS